VFICGERVNARTVFKWAIGVLAIVVLIGVGATLWDWAEQHGIIQQIQ
jgi:hypothetical protein